MVSDVLSFCFFSFGGAIFFGFGKKTIVLTHTYIRKDRTRVWCITAL